ncbi:hypothetical protein GCM10023093_06520 [Nemorincola caseinilytica]|uniref:Uncharacterized protein n=1 Tax=Nemorincola caseinilytica TaxID=2054315 RepID=A0ABP8N5E0_9BACT
MKIRIKGNSVRIRVTRPEAEKLAAGESLQETTMFPNGTFTYALQSKTGITGLEAGFAAGTMTMYMPAPLAAVWAGNDTVGYSNSLPLPGGGSLFLLLEKDFKCIDAEVTEDQSDNYENPLISCE